LFLPPELPQQNLTRMPTPVRHVVYLHGFASSPASGKAERFRAEVERCGAGYSCPDLNLPAFETLTTTRMLSQVAQIVAAIPEGPVALVGSSLGAFVAVHAAAADTTGRIDRLILLAPALDFGGNRLRQLGPHGIDEWRDTGHLKVFHYGDGIERNVGYALYSDAARYDAITLPTHLPTLVFQGDHDESVDPAMVRRWADGRPLVDLRMLHDGHQLSDSIDYIWAESAAFLGVSAPSGPSTGPYSL
jgi:pimeloyl-ACP methyl ester carboxylesterase